MQNPWVASEPENRLETPRLMAKNRPITISRQFENGIRSRPCDEIRGDERKEKRRERGSEDSPLILRRFLIPMRRVFALRARTPLFQYGANRSGSAYLFGTAAWADLKYLPACGPREPSSLQKKPSGKMQTTVNEKHGDLSKAP